MKVRVRKDYLSFGKCLRVLPVSLALVSVAFAEAQEFGLKPEITSPPIPTPVLTPASLLQMLLALVLVALLLRFALPKLLQRLSGNAIPSTGRVVVLDATPTANGHLYLVKAIDRTLLLGVTSQSITVLSEWEDEKSPLHASPSQAEPSPAFQEILKKLQQLEQ